jgi:hypothetical protein
VQVTWTVAVSSAGLQAPPSGTTPSETVIITGTTPAEVHVKLVTAAVEDVNVPLGADHAYARLLGSGPVAPAMSETAWPTVASDGLTLTVVTVPQK